MMTDPVSDDSLTVIDDTSAKHLASTRLTPNTILTRLLFNDEVQKAIEQVGAHSVPFTANSDITTISI